MSSRPISDSMIFHHPLPINRGGQSGSAVRPRQMAAAFARLGHDVHLVVGASADRRDAIRVLRGRASGESFVYAESATIATSLADPHHLPLRPLLDVRFFQRVRQSGVPVGLFYRDVYWRFPETQTRTPWQKRWIGRAAFELEWQQYRRSVDHLFLPSEEMAAALPTPWPEDRRSALPPGCVVTDVGNAAVSETTRALYVGGVLPPAYDLRPTMEVLRQLDGVTLTLCCREGEWETARSLYDPLPESVRVVHASGDRLTALYGQADVMVAVREPDPYLSFAMPVKVFESLGHGVPVITNAEAAAGRLVQRDGFGWAVDGVSGLADVLATLQSDPTRLAERRARTREVRHEHTWEVRAQTAASVLGRYRAEPSRPVS